MSQGWTLGLYLWFLTSGWSSLRLVKRTMRRLVRQHVFLDSWAAKEGNNLPPVGIEDKLIRAPTSAAFFGLEGRQLMGIGLTFPLRATVVEEIG